MKHFPGTPTATAADPATPARGTPFPGIPTADGRADPPGPPPGAVLRLRRIGPGSDLPPTAVMLALLDDAERARAGRTVDATQSASFVAGRYLLRTLAADLFGTRASLLESCFDCPACGPDVVPDHGRPSYLLRGDRVPLALSLSRSGGFVLLGALETHRGHAALGTVGRHGRRGAHGTPTSPDTGSVARPGLGVDLATVAEMGFDGFDDVALTPEERSVVGRLPVGDRGAARARLWARKEALVKALGTGFADHGPDEVEVLRERRITDLPSVGGEELEPLGLVAAVAVGP